ncbi:MAG: agmatine deiminase family protein [Myxococcaceae bacterium]
MAPSPAQDFHYPAEWTPHRAVWVAWPCHKDLWQENLPAAQDSFAKMCRIIGESESLEVLVDNTTAAADAKRALGGLPVRFHDVPYGDIWLRDTAPVFLRNTDGQVATARFQFNGWGGKYVLPNDDKVSAAIAKRADAATFAHGFVLEGGSVEVDGEGTLLTTRQCLQNPNRNPGASEAQVAQWLNASLGTRRVLWLDEGLRNDHTDGHIDTLVRFVAPGQVVCMSPAGPEDPNAKVLRDIARALEGFSDAAGQRLRVHHIPSPGLVVSDDEEVMPASYVNFYIANGAVVVPTYGAPNDAAAVSALSALFPERKTVGVSAKAILSGGGAFHCITQQEPLSGRQE